MNEDTQALLERWPIASSYDLPEKSTVMIVGAYKGLTMELLDELYHPRTIIGFEPQAWACLQARERLAYRSNCRVLMYGLGMSNIEAREMGEFNTDAASFINTGKGSRMQGHGNMRDADYVLSSFAREYESRYGDAFTIHLMVMNIEAYEFTLLPFLIEKGWLERIERLSVQFHLGFGNDGNVGEILAAIDETHDRTVDEYPAWITWVKR